MSNCDWRLVRPVEHNFADCQVGFDCLVGGSQARTDWASRHEKSARGRRLGLDVDVGFLDLAFVNQFLDLDVDVA